MCRLIWLLTSVILFLGCSKIPSEEELLKQPAVFTTRDTLAEFGNYRSFFIADTIAFLDNSSLDTILIGSDVSEIINVIRQQMFARGYQFAPLAEMPDLGISVTYLKNASPREHYSPGYWTSYPHYFSPYYYWDHYWYYPFSYPPVSVPYTKDAMVIDIVDIKNAASKQRFTVVWNVVMSGIIGSGKSVELQSTTQSINQAFSQSPYLNAK